MTARTFGRKGGIGAPAQRRTGLVAHQPRSFEPIERQAADDDEVAAKRAAFLAEERARADGAAALPLAAATESALRAFKAGVEFPPPVDRSLKTAYLLWFTLGLGGGHRFYLRRPLTGTIQALLFIGCLGAVLAQYYQAFAGLALSWLWMLADGFLIRRLYRTAAAR